MELNFTPYENGIDNLMALQQIEPFAVGMLEGLAEKIQQDINNFILDTSYSRFVRDSYRKMNISVNIIDKQVVRYFSTIANTVKPVFFNMDFDKSAGKKFFNDIIYHTWDDNKLNESQRTVYHGYNNTLLSTKPVLRIEGDIYKIII